MDKTYEAKIVLETITKMIDSHFKKLKFNRKVKGVVTNVNTDGTVNLTINDESYENIKVRPGLTLEVGNLVWVEIPNSNLRYMFVDMKL